MTKILPALALAASLAGTGAMATETTVIEQHREIRAAPLPAQSSTEIMAPHRAVIHHVARTASRRTIRASYRARHAIIHRQTPILVREPDHNQSPPAAAPTQGVDSAATTTIDRKTVIHRDDDGDVTRHTRIEKTDPDGTQTTIEHHSTTAPETDHSDSDDH